MEEIMSLFSWLNLPTKSLTISAVILAVSTFLNAVLALLRDLLLYSRFGAGRELDVYVASFRLPDFVYNLLVAGVLAVAVLPVFAENFRESEEKAWRLVNNFLNFFLFVLLAVGGFFFFFTPRLATLAFPGFAGADLERTIGLTRLFFLSPIFFGLVGIFSGLLQYFNKFLALAVSPLIYNLGIIFGIVFLSPRWGIEGVAWSVVIAAFIYFLLQVLVTVACGWRWQPIFDWQDGSLWRVLRLMLPRVLTAASSQLNLLVMTGLASTLGLGAISIFYFANNLQGFAVNLVGISFATAAFSRLTKSAAERDRETFRRDFNFAFHRIFWISLALSALLFVFRHETSQILLFLGRRDAQVLSLVSASVGLFAVSIFAQAEIPLLLRAFFSWQRAAVPTVISLLGVVVNIVLSFGLVSLVNSSPVFRQTLDHFLGLPNSLAASSRALLALPLSFSLAALPQFFLLWFFLKKELRS